MFDDPWPADRPLLKTIAGFSIPILLVGAIGYRYLTTATPVSAHQALQLFRADKGTAVSEAASRDGASTKETRSAPRERTPERDRAQRQPVRSKERATTRRVETVPAAPPTQQRAEPQPEERAARERRQKAAAFVPGAPEEGVYSWDTEGYESFNGSRRAFPRETQRIITRHGKTSWTLHHYFSEERESWTEVASDADGYSSAEQRNKVVFGPVTRDVNVTFDPPMVTGPMPARLGATWNGRWEGKTYGTYSGRYFEKTSITVDGERVEVWGIELRIHLRGETEGETWAQVWVSPESHMVIREHYRQDAQTGPGTYKAEWLMTVKSLTPQR